MIVIFPNPEGRLTNPSPISNQHGLVLARYALLDKSIPLGAKHS